MKIKQTMTIIAYQHYTFTERNSSPIIEEPSTAIALPRGIPSFSFLFNTTFIHEITGNTLLPNASVICLSDYHCDPLQKYIRAYIINKVFHETSYCDDILFLIEGTHYGKFASRRDIETIIGSDLITNLYHVAGWDDYELLEKGLKKIRKLQTILGTHKRTCNKIQMLQQKQASIFSNVKIPIDEAMVLLEKIDAIIDEESASLEVLTRKIESLTKKIERLAKERNVNLYKAIQTVHKAYPEKKVVVIAGGNHFEGISEELCGIKHAVILIKNTKKMGDIDEELKGYYGEKVIKAIKYV